MLRPCPWSSRAAAQAPQSAPSRAPPAGSRRLMGSGTRLELGHAGGDHPLEALHDLEALDSFVADYAQARVDDARAAGASWAEIADRLGVTRQAAHKRFGGKEPRKTSLELRLIWDRKKQS